MATLLGVRLSMKVIRPRRISIACETAVRLQQWSGWRSIGLSTRARACHNEGLYVAGSVGQLSRQLRGYRWYALGSGAYVNHRPAITACSPSQRSSPWERIQVRSTSNGGPIKQIRQRILSSLNTPHENIYTIPNLLTFSRLLAAPVIGYLVLHDQHAWAVGLFAYAAITDLIDGYIARTWRLQTVVGTVIDPMADKTLMTILTVCLAIKGGIPVWLASIILGRDVGLGLAALYYRWISLPAPKTLSRYWDFSLPSVEVHPTGISKINTALQLVLIGACTAQPLLLSTLVVSPEILSPVMSAMHYLVATTTIWSGVSYIYTKDAVRILSRK